VSEHALQFGEGDPLIPWEELDPQYPNLSTAREWFRDLRIEGSGDEFPIVEKEDGTFEVTFTPPDPGFEQYVGFVTWASGYTIGPGHSEEAVERILIWIMEDIGHLALFSEVGGVRRSQLSRLDEAARLGQRIVQRTFEAAAEYDKTWYIQRAHGKEERARQDAEAALGKDHLTGQANKVGYEKIRDSLLRTSKEEGASPYGYGEALVDLTNFKRINDALTHDIGDHALRAAAAELSRHARQGDNPWLARVSGDEFIMMLGHTTSEGLASYVWRVREAQASKLLPQPLHEEKLSRYEAAWRKIMSFDEQKRKLYSHIRIEESKADDAQDPPTRPAQILYIGDTRICRLEDIVVLSIGGAHQYGEGGSDGMRGVCELSASQHKAELHDLMGGKYRPA